MALLVISHENNTSKHYSFLHVLSKLKQNSTYLGKKSEVKCFGHCTHLRANNGLMLEVMSSVILESSCSTVYYEHYQ